MSKAIPTYAHMWAYASTAGLAIFFHRDGDYLYCHNHGAIYNPESGLCIRGPCRGLSLIPLAVQVSGGKLFLVDEVYQSYD